MPYNSIVISSGHGKYVRGASGILDEVDEARKVVNKVAELLTSHGVTVKKFHDDTSHDQNTNLNTIVSYHNNQKRQLDISVHFNAYEQVSKPMGTECLYVTQSALASQMAAAVADAGFINRGGKKRTDLFFLNNTAKPAILIEICFVDSEADAEIYERNFELICENISDLIGGAGDVAPAPPQPDSDFHVIGKCSYFGGPNDQGVSPSEGLALYSSVSQREYLFLPSQPPGTSGLARRLNEHIHYVAARWDYSKTPKEMLGKGVALVKSLKHGTFQTAFPADWGPNENTGRVADLSPGLMADLGIETDDEVEVIFPHEADQA